MEIYGTNLTTTSKQWSGDDFVNNTAPTTLGGVKVTINGIPAFLYYVFPGQIGCVAPDGIGTGEVNVVVTNANGTSDSYKVTAVARSPGLLAPPAFKSANKQFVTALFPDATFVGPENLIPGALFRPAAAGERLVLYGIGFGPTNPVIPAGRIVTGAATLSNVEVKLGDKSATVEYAGLAGSFVGLYQFNIIVPAGVSGEVRLTVSVGGTPLVQELWIATQ